MYATAEINHCSRRMRRRGSALKITDGRHARRSWPSVAVRCSRVSKPSPPEDCLTGPLWAPAERCPERNSAAPQGAPPGQRGISRRWKPAAAWLEVARSMRVLHRPGNPNGHGVCVPRVGRRVIAVPAGSLRTPHVQGQDALQARSGMDHGMAPLHSVPADAHRGQRARKSPVVGHRMIERECHVGLVFHRTHQRIGDGSFDLKVAAEPGRPVRRDRFHRWQEARRHQQISRAAAIDGNIHRGTHLERIPHCDPCCVWRHGRVLIQIKVSGRPSLRSPTLEIHHHFPVCRGRNADSGQWRPLASIDMDQARVAPGSSALARQDPESQR